MTNTLRYVWVIARRDYLASVLSRAFLLFLVAPLLPFAFGDLFASDGGRLVAQQGIRILVDASTPQGRSWLEARDRLGRQFPGADLPTFSTAAPARGDAMLTGTVERPVLRGSRRPGPEQLLGVGLVAEEAKSAAEARGSDPATPALRLDLPAAKPTSKADDAGLLAQIGTLMLTMLLSGIMLSSLVEERSTKALDVLLAALPVHVVFYGKLLSVLLMAFTGMAVWLASAMWFAAPALAALNVTGPAIGWPIFIVLTLLYSVSAILLFGAVYLAAGAYASTARELQAVAVPLTVVQVLSFALALNGTSSSDPVLRLAAFVVPWSSPFSMLGLGSSDRSILPHLVAIPWQVACAYVVVRWSASAFRESVLNGRPLTLIKRLQAARARASE